MARRKRLLLISAAVPLALLALFLATAQYHLEGGIHSIVRPPVASVTWGPSASFIVPSGINVVRDPPMGAPGTRACRFGCSPFGGSARNGARGSRITREVRPT
jgi:hypothetical protein